MYSFYRKQECVAKNVLAKKKNSVTNVLTDFNVFLLNILMYNLYFFLINPFPNTCNFKVS